MNKQMIRRLAIETDAWCDQFHLEDPYYTAHWEEKFAELIVKECAEFARQHNLAKADRSHLIHRAIQEHFGVEE